MKAHLDTEWCGFAWRVDWQISVLHLLPERPGQLSGLISVLVGACARLSILDSSASVLMPMSAGYSGEQTSMATAQVGDRYCFHTHYVQELEKGNAAIMDHFISYFRPRLRSFLRKNGAPHDIVEDLQQETFLRVLVALRSRAIRHPERLGSFVNAVCRNALLESYRDTRRYTELDVFMDEIPDEGPDPDEKLLLVETSSLLQPVLARLSTRDQKLLSLFFIEQRSNAEVCKALGVSSGYLRLLLHRVKRRLAEHINSNERKQFLQFKSKKLLRMRSAGTRHDL
jgi:RNA polymerase sigma factor (sigma-70 family)